MREPAGGFAPCPGQLRWSRKGPCSYPKLRSPSGEAVVDSAELVLDYTHTNGDFGGPRYDARCRSLVDETTEFVAFNRCPDSCDDGANRELYLRFGTGQTSDDLVFRPPGDVFECLFRGAGETLSGLTSVLRLYDVALNPIPNTGVEVRVECDGWPNPTTTTISSTTTLTCSEPECEQPNTTFQFWLDDAVTLGSLQFDVYFPKAVGAFVHFNRSNVRCDLAPGVNALFATNQGDRLDGSNPNPDEQRLTVGFIFTRGHTGPGKLLTCDFAVGERPPTAGDFLVRVADASTPTVDSVIPLPTVSIRGFPRE